MSKFYRNYQTAWPITGNNYFKINQNVLLRNSDFSLVVLCVCVCVCVLYICVCVCVCVCIYIYICIGCAVLVEDVASSSPTRD